jgi:hypothetical protein
MSAGTAATTITTPTGLLTIMTARAGVRTLVALARGMEGRSD